jgi:hypothetical protein
MDVVIHQPSFDHLGRTKQEMVRSITRRSTAISRSVNRLIQRKSKIRLLMREVSQQRKSVDWLDTFFLAVCLAVYLSASVSIERSCQGTSVNMAAQAFTVVVKRCLLYRYLSCSLDISVWITCIKVDASAPDLFFAFSMQNGSSAAQADNMDRFGSRSGGESSNELHHNMASYAHDTLLRPDFRGSVAGGR